jgi:hypothetical protein
MNRRTLALACLVVTIAAPAVLAISPGTDLLIAGAVRTPHWRSDLYINNAGATTVSVDVLWLVRDQANPDPESRTYSIGPGETLILDDVLENEFDKPGAEGAFRIKATGGEVTANLIVYSGFSDAESGTFGSGFEAIPSTAATRAGQTTTLMGLVSSSPFYTNIFALAGADGVTMDLDLLDPDGALLDTARVILDAYEPWLSYRTDLWDEETYENGTLLVQVSAGSAVIMGSKTDETDEINKDPTTLEPALGGPDATYQFAIYDSLAFASGGNLVIADNVVEVVNGTYTNFDKGVIDPETGETIPDGESECTLILQFGLALTPTAVEAFEDGITFTDTYPDDPEDPNDGGSMTWKITFSFDSYLGFSGTIDAVGSEFVGIDEGCNGAFPPLQLEGGVNN